MGMDIFLYRYKGKRENGTLIKEERE